MTEPYLLPDLATRREHSASRRLAERTGIPYAQALRQTLHDSAGAFGLEHLLAQRQRAAQAARQKRVERDAARLAAHAQRQARHDGPATPWRAWFDGSAHPNPGRCSIGGLLKGPGGELIEISLPAGFGNNGDAEYRALVAVLEAAVALGACPLTVYGDSQVVVEDVAAPPGRSVRSLHQYREAALALLARLPGTTVRWVPRHKNTEADALSQRAGQPTLTEAV